MFQAMLNQIPDTMPLSQIVLTSLAGLTSVKGEDGDISLEKLQRAQAKQNSLFSNCVLILENRVERLEGRPGIPDDLLEAIMSEFRT